MKRSIPILIFVLALALAACAPTVVSGSDVPPQRTISVNGTGQAVLTPDIAYITIGVQSEAPSAREAVAQNNTQAQAVIAALLGMGVAEKDIRTTNFSIYPNQRYDRDGNPTEISYVVNNSVYVTIRDLDKIGDILDKVVQAGANQINSIQFDVADKTAALAAARDAAVAQAREQAEALAKAAGVSVDKVQSIQYYANEPAPIAKSADMMLMAEARSVPIQSGEMTLTVNVQMVFTIK
jgi:hypothetical protein